MSFKDKVVIVTGSSSGIGEATAIMFSKEGAKVTIVGRNEAKLKKVEKACADVGSAPLVIKGDVAVDDIARKIVDETIKKFGKLDVLVNNAGVLRYGTLMDGDLLKSYDDVMNINLRSVVHITMLAAPHLVKTKGNIINMSSISSEKPARPNFTAYCASKAAMNMLTRSNALEMAPFGVRVNAVAPGPVVTDIFENSDRDNLEIPTPLGRWGESDEIADLVLFLASDRARSITGSIYFSDNGTML